MTTIRLTRRERLDLINALHRAADWSEVDTNDLTRRELALIGRFRKLIERLSGKPSDLSEGKERG